MENCEIYCIIFILVVLAFVVYHHEKFKPWAPNYYMLSDLPYNAGADLKSQSIFSSTDQVKSGENHDF